MRIRLDLTKFLHFDASIDTNALITRLRLWRFCITFDVFFYRTAVENGVSKFLVSTDSAIIILPKYDLKLYDR